MKNLMKTVKSVLFIFLLIVFVISLPFAIPQCYNHIVVNKVKRELLRLPLPPNTSIVESDTYVGCRYAGGNDDTIHCIAGVLLKSDASLDELKEYYTALSSEGHRYNVTEMTGQSIYEEFQGETWGPVFKTDVSGGGCYALYSAGVNLGDKLGFHIEMLF